MSCNILLGQTTIGTVEEEVLVRKQYDESRAQWAKSLDVPLKIIKISTTWARGGSLDRVVRMTIYSGNVPDNEWNRKRLPEAFEGR